MNTDDLMTELWAYLDQRRGLQPSATLVDRWLRERIDTNGGRGVTPELLYALSRAKVQWWDGEMLTAEPLARFIARVAAIYSPKSVLDPTCGVGALLHTVATTVGAAVVHGIEINGDRARLARSVLGAGATVVDGDALAEPPEILDRYDLIAADPPLGVRVPDGVDVPGIGSGFRGEFGHALTLLACERLSDEGAALVVVTPAFLWGSGAARIHQAIHALGCRIRALIHLPGGSVPETSIASYLVVLERGRQSDVFVGQYDPDEGHQEQLVANFRRSRSGPQPALGRLCPLEDFKGFESFAALERLKRLARNAGWKGAPAAEVITGHSVLGHRRSEPLAHGPNSCYLRLIGRPLAVLDPDQLPGSGQHREVLHLHLNPTHADPRYMVHWFNASQIGQATLAMVTRGAVIPRVDRTSLLHATLYLPSIAEQSHAIEGASRLTQIRAAADELEAALWEGGNDVANIVREIATINQEDRFEDWIETLPFPLASILWRHHAGGDSARERYEVLLHFFEATAAFLATVHLSAFMSADDLWREHGRELNLKLTSQRLSLDRATFGSWKLAAEYLSSASAALVQEPEQAERWQRLYGTSNRQVLTMLGRPELRAAVQRANRIRNDWSGHAGAVGTETAKQIHDELVELVHTLRGVFGRAWLGYELVQPGEGRYRGGVHHYRARRLMGTRSAPFEEVQLESVQPLEADALYLFDSANRTGLRLQPFVRVMPSPEKRANACFIFNRREADRFRFVSYHFEEESEMQDTSSDIEQALGRLHMFDAESSE